MLMGDIQITSLCECNVAESGSRLSKCICRYFRRLDGCKHIFLFTVGKYCVIHILDSWATLDVACESGRRGFLVNLRRTLPNLMLKRCPSVFETFRNPKQLTEMERLQRHLVPFASWSGFTSSPHGETHNQNMVDSSVVINQTHECSYRIFQRNQSRRRGRPKTPQFDFRR